MGNQVFCAESDLYGWKCVG